MMIPSAPIAPSAPPARLHTIPLIVHSPFSPLRYSHNPGTITPIRKYANPTHTNGRSRAGWLTVDIPNWPHCNTGPYMPQHRIVRAIETTSRNEFRIMGLWSYCYPLVETIVEHR